MSEQQSKRKNRGDGAIEELASGKVKVRLSYIGGDGKRHRPTATFDTRKEAVEWRNKKLAEVAKGVLADAGKQTVRSWLEEWLVAKKTQVEVQTYTPFEAHVRLHLVPHVGGVRLAKLRSAHVKQLYEALEKAGVSRPLQRKVGTTLAMALEDAVKQDVLATNPAKKVKKPKARKVEVVPFTPAQVKLFLEAARGERVEALYVLAIDSGMRQGELFGLHWPAIDWQTDSVSVTQSLAELKNLMWLKAPKTESSRRKIRVSPATMAALNAHRAKMLKEGHYQPDGLVFPNLRGGFFRKSNLRRGSFDRILARAARLAKALPQPIPFPMIRFHDLRHTAATLLLMNGVNIKAVATRLGHSSAVVTLNVYSHFMPSMDEQAAKVMQSYLAVGT